MIATAVSAAVLLTTVLILVGPLACLLLVVAALVPILWTLIKESGAEAIREFFHRPEPPTKLLRDIKRVGEPRPWDLGARRSTLAEQLAGNDAPPYVRFVDVDDRLDALVRDGNTNMVVVRGHAGAGKSRMLAEAIGRHFPDSYLVIPNPAERDSIENLIECSDWFRGESRPVVVWLDRLEEYLQSGSVTCDVVDRAAACSPRYLFAATIRSEPLDRLKSSASESPRALDGELLARLLSEDGHRETQSLALLESTSLDARDDARATYSRLDMKKGLGLALVQRDVYLDGYRASGLDPLVRALVRAAVDLRMAGLRGPFSTDLLANAAAEHKTGGARHDRSAVREALAIANEPLGGREDLRLLIAQEKDCWTVDDLLLDIDAGRAGVAKRQIAKGTWAIAADAASPADLIVLAENASAAHCDGQAEMLWSQAIATDDPEHAPLAMYRLGVMYDEQGDSVKATQSWEQAARSRHSDYAPQAMFNLGSIYYEGGETENAIDACERAIATSHPEHAPRAMWNLGVIYDEQGETEKAIAILERASETPHRDAVSKATYRLGAIYDMRGETDQAINAYERTIAIGEYAYEVPAMQALANLHEKHGEPKQAAEARERARATSSQMDYGWY